MKKPNYTQLISSIKIDKNVPMPTKEKPLSWGYFFSKAKVKDSFVVSKKEAQIVRGNAYHYGVRLTSAVVGGNVRFWITAKTKKKTAETKKKTAETFKPVFRWTAKDQQLLDSYTKTIKAA